MDLNWTCCDVGKSSIARTSAPLGVPGACPCIFNLYCPVPGMTVADFSQLATLVLVRRADVALLIFGVVSEKMILTGPGATWPCAAVPAVIGPTADLTEESTAFV